MLPIYIFKKGVKLPDHGSYYVVTADGIFLRKDTGLLEALVKVEGISSLRKLQPFVKSRLPKIPARLIASCWGFFRKIMEQLESEAAILLHYSAATHQYQLCCPPQEVSLLSVRYDCTERFEGYQLVGIVHSHGHLRAWHSDEDEANERKFDGLHITVGQVHERYLDLSCTLVVNGNQFPQPPEAVINGIKAVRAKPSWLDGLADVPTFAKKLNRLGQQELGQRLVQYFGTKFYKLALPNPDQVLHFPKEWLTKAKVKPKPITEILL